MDPLRSRLDRLHRRLAPAGLVGEWEQVLTVIAERWGRSADGLGAEAISDMARAAARGGRHPGDVLAVLLVAAAQSNEEASGGPKNCTP